MTRLPASESHLPRREERFSGRFVHALRSSDYPLPAPYLRAFDASSRLVFETDPKTMAAATKGLIKAGQYRKGDSLKNHVDPRTYAYVRRFFALRNVPEEKFNTYRPWLIDVMLEAPPNENYELGVDRFLRRKALAARKPITGLESVEEHIAPFVGLSDREGEALLLIYFINMGRAGTSGNISTSCAAATLSSARHGVAYMISRLSPTASHPAQPALDPEIEGTQERQTIRRGPPPLGGAKNRPPCSRPRYTVEQL